MSLENTVSPFFGAYNARHINAEEVASQFVPSTKFWELIALRNSLLIGPRGSGKTHLLKMLQPKALAAWSGAEAEKAREKIDYWGVFTPADVNWKVQVDQKAKHLEADNPSDFSKAIFLSHFREAFVSSLLQLTRDRPRQDFGGLSNKIDLSKDKEVQFCVDLASSWQLKLGIPSLDGLKLAIVDELVSLGRLSQGGGLSSYIQRLLGMDLISVAREIAQHFESATNIYSARWALCFDELEIAPQAIQSDLFRYLRSSDQRFIFKLAISPSNDASSLLNSLGAASVGNDYDPIPLWLTDQREREQFCMRLWEKHATGTTAAPLAPYTILQRSRFQYSNSVSSHGPRRYGSAAGWKNDFVELERKDLSFADFLRVRGIKSSSLDATSKEKMNSIVRKIAPIVGFRNAYLSRDANGGLARRPLKRAPPDIFSGWEAICTATEGNPRWFSGIASRLILKWSQSPSGKELSREQQTQELESSARKFLAWINAIPVESNADGSTMLSLHKFLDVLAGSFEYSTLGKTFTADPIGAFTVDVNTPESIQRLVIASLNIGAIVIIDDEDVKLTVASPVGRTFRLVHLLAPIFNLPMRRGKARVLSTLLAKSLGSLEKFRPTPIKAAADAKAKAEASPQLGLF